MKRAGIKRGRRIQLAAKGKTIKKRGFISWACKFFFRLILIAIVITVLQVVSLRFINPPFTMGMAWSWLEHKFSSRYTRNPRFHWRDLAEISPHLKKAVLAGEDQRFLTHHGFDLIELDKALRDFFADKRVRGASTISMQVARTVFLWHQRSWSRKLLEAYYTVLLEVFLTKPRIFEIYLNMVDWGEGIRGAEAASMKYFQISSRDIAPNQGALLAAILPSPHRWSPTKPNEIVRVRQARIMKDMNKMPEI